ncbi:MAG: hypothetical protein IJ730_04475 [Alphaproteobacteria bacterium]|nr:hypothetical protein [Alphaproteobacteria bacterium]
MMRIFINMFFMVLFQFHTSLCSYCNAIEVEPYYNQSIKRNFDIFYLEDSQKKIKSYSSSRFIKKFIENNPWFRMEFIGNLKKVDSPFVWKIKVAFYNVINCEAIHDYIICNRVSYTLTRSVEDFFSTFSKKELIQFADLLANFEKKYYWLYFKKGSDVDFIIGELESSLRMEGATNIFAYFDLCYDSYFDLYNQEDREMYYNNRTSKIINTIFPDFHKIHKDGPYCPEEVWMFWRNYDSYIHMANEAEILYQARTAFNQGNIVKKEKHHSNDRTCNYVTELKLPLSPISGNNDLSPTIKPDINHLSATRIPSYEMLNFNQLSPSKSREFSETENFNSQSTTALIKETAEVVKSNELSPSKPKEFTEIVKATDNSIQLTQPTKQLSELIFFNKLSPSKPKEFIELIDPNSLSEKNYPIMRYKHSLSPLIITPNVLEYSGVIKNFFNTEDVKENNIE